MESVGQIGCSNSWQVALFMDDRYEINTPFSLKYSPRSWLTFTNPIVWLTDCWPCGIIWNFEWLPAKYTLHARICNSELSLVIGQFAFEIALSNYMMLQYVTINGRLIHQFSLLLRTTLGRMLLVEIRVWNNLERTRLHNKCFCGVLKGRKIKERWFGWFGHGKTGARAKYAKGKRMEGSTCRQTSWFWKPCSAASMGCDWLGFSHIRWTGDLVEFCNTLQTWLQRYFRLVAKSCCH